MSDKKDAMVPVTPSSLASLGITKNDVAELFEENMQYIDRFKFPSIALLHSGALSFSISHPDSDRDDKTSNFKGVVLATKMRKVYWSRPFDGQGTPPDCASDDTIHGSGSPGGLCHACPMNQFESAINSSGEKAPGKACKDLTALYVLIYEDGKFTDFPYELIIPPNGLRAWMDYSSGLIIRRLPIQAVITNFGLVEGNMKSSVIAPHSVGMVTREQYEFVKGLRQIYGQAINARKAVEMDKTAATGQRVVQQPAVTHSPANGPTTDGATGDESDVPF